MFPYAMKLMNIQKILRIALNSLYSASRSGGFVVSCLPVDNSVDVEYDGFVEQEMPVVIWEGLE